MHSQSIPLALLVCLVLSETALARPQIRDVILQVDGTGKPVDEIAIDSTITMTTHRTVTVSIVESIITSDFASEISAGTGSITTESFPVLPTLPASAATLSATVRVLSTITNTSSTSSMPAQTRSSTSGSTFIRGVNLGGWLVLEEWMDSDAFAGAFSNAVDQWTFDSIPGAEEALTTHWSTYFTEDDINTIAATGINALRIPIGFWAYNNSGTPYIQGADAFLEQAIGWAKTAGMKVWVDCHGSPGSQNGFDNSGHEGAAEWQQSDNLARSIAVLQTMATKYGSLEYADTVIGLQLVNEPISWGNNTFSTTQSWAANAFAAVKASAANPNLTIIMHDAFEGPLAWTSVAESLPPTGQFAIDTHLYQLFTNADNALTQAQHITKACSWASSLAAAKAVMPTFVGEWSATTNICVNPDGSTTAGTSCSVPGCQCESADFSTWNDALIEQARMFVEAQLDVFESSSSGYFMWAAKGPGVWGVLNGIGNGVIPNPVTSRRYPGQCGSGSRRTRRGALGVVPEAF